MIKEDKKQAGLFCESDPSAARRLSDSGFGRMNGNQPVFHPLEVAYMLKLGIASSDRTLQKFVAGQAKRDRRFPFAFDVYSCIRQTGRIVRPYSGKEGAGYLRAYAPGAGRLEERPSHIICLLPGKAPSANSLGREIAIAHKVRLDLIVAYGEPGSVRFVKVAAFNF